MKKPDRNTILAFAAIGFVTYPIARFAGEPIAALICFTAALVVGIHHAKR